MNGRGFLFGKMPKGRKLFEYFFMFYAEKRKITLKKIELCNIIELYFFFNSGGFFVELLKQMIREKGIVREGNILKVDSFLNHQMDIKLFNEIGKEFKRIFDGEKITKILTIEASGIGIACITAQYFDVPVVFAKKSQTKNIAGDVYSTKVQSFTHGRVYDVIVSKDFLHKDDRVLIIDDFLANGCALLGLLDLVKCAGAEVAGAGIVVEKGFQHGGKEIRDKGIRVESLAIIDSMSVDGGVVFRD